MAPFLRGILSIFLSQVQLLYIGITKNRNFKNFDIWWPLSVLGIFDPASMMSSGEGSQSTSLDYSNKPVEQCELSVDHLQFSISYWWRISLSIYLSIPTRLFPITWDYNRCCSIIGFYYLLHTNFNLNLKTADQPGFGSRSPRTNWLCYHCATLQWLQSIVYLLFNWSS